MNHWGSEVGWQVGVPGWHQGFEGRRVTGEGTGEKRETSRSCYWVEVQVVVLE